MAGAFGQTSELGRRLLAAFSAEFGGLTLMIDYEDHARRRKGLIKAVGGAADHCTFSY